MAQSYADIFLGPLRSTSFKVFAVIEVILFAGGFGMAQIGTENTTLGAHPDVHLAMGGIMAGIGMVFAAAFLVIYVANAIWEVRGQVEQNVEF